MLHRHFPPSPLPSSCTPGHSDIAHSPRPGIRKRMQPYLPYMHTGTSYNSNGPFVSTAFHQKKLIGYRHHITSLHSVSVRAVQRSTHGLDLARNAACRSHLTPQDCDGDSASSSNSCHAVLCCAGGAPALRASVTPPPLWPPLPVVPASPSCPFCRSINAQSLRMAAHGQGCASIYSLHLQPETSRRNR